MCQITTLSTTHLRAEENIIWKIKNYYVTLDILVKYFWINFFSDFLQHSLCTKKSNAQRVVIWQFFLRSEPERKIVSEIKPPLLLHTQSQRLVSFQNFLLMTQGWWIQWTTYYMMTPWMRCLEYQALCLLHFIWEQLQQKTSQQSIQHSRWQLFVSISQRVQVISEGAFLLWRIFVRTCRL